MPASMKRHLRFAERSLRYPIALLCTYEALAIFTGQCPSITEFSSRHRWIAAVAAGLVAWHLIAYPGDEFV